MMAPLYHPLIGVSPISACGLAAILAIRMQTSSAVTFANGCRPGGIVQLPANITQATADRVKADWTEKFSGGNAGSLAVITGDIKFQQLGMSPVDAAIIEQLGWTDEAICRCFHVPRYKVEVGPEPSYNNINALDSQYYTQCLQIHIESIELLLDEGLELPKPYGVDFDLDDLMRMDQPTLIESEGKAIRRRHQGAERIAETAEPVAGPRRRDALPAAAELLAGRAGRPRRARDGRPAGAPAAAARGRRGRGRGADRGRRRGRDRG